MIVEEDEEFDKDRYLQKGFKNPTNISEEKTIIIAHRRSSIAPAGLSQSQPIVSGDIHPISCLNDVTTQPLLTACSNHQTPELNMVTVKRSSAFTPLVRRSLSQICTVTEDNVVAIQQSSGSIWTSAGGQNSPRQIRENQLALKMGFTRDSRKQSEDKAVESTKLSFQLTDMRNDALSIVLSALYCKILVVLGLALPVTEVLAPTVPDTISVLFHAYLYVGSLLFMCGMYVTLLKDKAYFSIIRTYNKRNNKDSKYECPRKLLGRTKRLNRYGSFYLRLGAVGFGIGSMVYSGLELGQYLDVNRKPECQSLTPAVTSALRMIIILFQMQFTFLNSRNMDMCQSYSISRFGLMHMIATNVCEWLNVIVQETKHEINFLESEILQGTKNNNISIIAQNCDQGEIMGNIVHNVSPFLFPCTIEYSLICAVIMLEIWKHVKVNQHGNKPRHSSKNDIHGSKTAYNFSIDCSHAHKGLFGGIVVVVFTIISLIIFFVLQGIPDYHDTGRFELNLWEFCLHALSTAAVLIASVQMRKLHYRGGITNGLGLDNTLLVLAQGGVYIYSVFSLIGCYFTTKDWTTLLSDTSNLLQATLQTLFILEAWSRRSRTHLQWTKKPGRPMITFLLITNMAAWIVNSLEKNRAQFRPKHLELFGIWAWTIITHVSMPLAIFYRFHSTICLFEIWKNAYKMPNTRMTPQNSFTGTQV